MASTDAGPPSTANGIFFDRGDWPYFLSISCGPALVAGYACGDFLGERVNTGPVLLFGTQS